MLKELRDELGISQSDLSAYLMITRSQLSMAEIHRRLIPPQKMLLLVDFYNVMKAPAQNKKSADDKLTDALAKQNSKRNRIIERQLDDCRCKLAKIKKQLDEVRNRQEQALKILGKIKGLEAVAGSANKDLVAIINSQARNRQGKSGIDVQFKLEIQVAGLEGQIAFLEDGKAGNR